MSPLEVAGDECLIFILFLGVVNVVHASKVLYHALGTSGLVAC